MSLQCDSFFKNKQMTFARVHNWDCPFRAVLTFSIFYPTADRQRFISTPDKPTKAFIGSNVSLVWRYYQPAHISLIKVVFGYWKIPGYVFPRVMTINGTTNIPEVMTGYEYNIRWAGNLTDYLAAFVVCNIQPVNVRLEFGIHLEFGYRHNPLRDSVRIKVEKKRE